MAENFFSKIKFEEVIDGGYRFYCLNAIVELGIQDILVKNGNYMSAVQIADEIAAIEIVNTSNLQRILRYLACFDLVLEKYVSKDDRTIVFKATDVLKQLPILQLFLGKALFPRIKETLDVNLTNAKNPLANNVFGKSFWQLVKADTSLNQLLLNTLTSLTDELKPFIPKIAEIIKAEGISDASIIDIGGSTGEFMEMLKKELPTLQCSSFDLKHVIENNNPVDNIEMVAGDMFDKHTIPSKDIYITKNVFHDWSDEQCVQILKNIGEKMNDGGIVMSVNFMLPEPGEMKEAWCNRSMDLNSLVILDSARARTETEFREIHQQAGFTITRVDVIGEKQRPSLVLLAKKIID